MPQAAAARVDAMHINAASTRAAAACVCWPKVYAARKQRPRLILAALATPHVAVLQVQRVPVGNIADLRTIPVGWPAG